MSIITDYIAYIKHNPNHYWFKRKVYGWGWTPVTWQGWAVLGIAIALIVLSASRHDITSSSPVSVPFLLETAGILVVLIYICYKKGEKPKWTWGFPKDTEKDVK